MERCPVHRELPPRRCGEPGCLTWLTSRNPDHVCVSHGGWRRVKERDDARHNCEREEGGAQLADVLAV